MPRPTQPVEIAKGIFWVGALDPDLKRFDVVMDTEFGSSYNAYLVLGDQMTALVDCVKDGFLDQSLSLIRQIIDPAGIDYIILQHTEPDHSGALAELLAIAKNAKILCTGPAAENLPFIAHRDLPLTVVRDGDTLDLGNRTLRFISAPFLHWPDTMFTYDAQTSSLFTCDAFGCHYTPYYVRESRTESQFKNQRRFYYDCVMSPFAKSVEKAVAKLRERNLSIRAILPSHGPVLDESPQEIVDLYDRWSKEFDSSAAKKVFIPYVSSYGYTGRLAKSVEAALNALGVETDLADIAELPSDDVAHRIHTANGLALGSPTVNQDALPPVWQALSLVSAPLVRGRKAIVFGSYGWSGEGVPYAEQRLKNLGFQVVGTLRVRFKPDDKSLSDARALAVSLAKALW